MPEGDRACKICRTRRSRRYCPGVEGDICPICCGTEREVTVNCPLECAYLLESRRWERAPEVDAKQLPNLDIKVEEEFLRRNEPLLILIASSVARNALASSNTYDSDVRQALDGLIRTYRTLHSGLVYESRPDNPLAARVFSGVQDSVIEIRERLATHDASVRDDDVLGVLVFLQRLEIQHTNGRAKGRAFIDFLRQFFPPEHPKPSGDLILT
jgi:hypothetical protein